MEKLKARTGARNQTPLGHEITIRAEEPAFVARYAFQLAQAFNLFNHHHHIHKENDPAKKKFMLQLSRLVEVQLVAALELLGIESPEQM